VAEAEDDATGDGRLARVDLALVLREQRVHREEMLDSEKLRARDLEITLRPDFFPVEALRKMSDAKKSKATPVALAS